MEKLNIGNVHAREADTFTSSVYSSRYAAEDLPKLAMPEGEMPKEVGNRGADYSPSQLAFSSGAKSLVIAW